MKYLDDFRNPDAARVLLEQIRQTVTRPWTIMEVCGGQTHAIVRNALDQLLPDAIELVHGPGCPVCVTPLAMIDRALAIAACPGVIMTTFGDMLRVPGSHGNLATVRGAGNDVRVLYSPLEATTIARQHPDREVVFFGVGFETTAPATALAVWQAERAHLTNFSLLASHVLIPAAMSMLLAGGEHRIDAFLAAGHVCAVSGLEPYFAIAEKHRVPIVVTGFEPGDLLTGILAAVTQLEAGRAEVENCYRRVVRDEGNRRARALVQEVFETTDRSWRGLGPIPKSGLKLRERYRRFDAECKFTDINIESIESPACLSGRILQGLIKPTDCPAFGTGCSPSHPLGATMVSSEGACAAYFRYSQHSLTPVSNGPGR
jgi:hydrogenase expression/formation protein HypD